MLTIILTCFHFMIAMTQFAMGKKLLSKIL